MGIYDKFNEEIFKLISDMIGLFEKRQRGKYINARIHRGRISPLANDFEDRFAKFLFAILPSEYSMLIDYPLTVRLPNRKKAITVYPDIVIIRDDIIKCIFELKIDLGYTEDKWFAEKQAAFGKFRLAGKVSYLVQAVDFTKEKRELKVPNDTEIAFIILSSKNDHGRAARISGARTFFTLLNGFHPNTSKIFMDDKEKTAIIIGKDEKNRIEWMNLRKFLNERLDIDL